MAGLVRFSLPIALIAFFLMAPPQLCGQTVQLPSEIDRQFEERFARYRSQKRSLEGKLPEYEALLRRAETGTNASNPRVAAENREAVQVMKQEIALTKQDVQSLEANIRSLERKRESCKQAYRKISSTRSALERLRQSIESGTTEIEEWAKQSQEGAEGALNASLELLKSATMAGLGKEIDKEIELLEDSARLEELKSLKAAIDQTTAIIAETDSAGDLLRDRDLESALKVLTSALGDPTIQNLLKLNPAVDAITTSLTFSVEFSLRSLQFASAWERIRQLDLNSEGFLQAARSLHEEMKRNVEDLAGGQCDARELIG